MCSRDSSMSAFHMGGDDSNTGICLSLSLIFVVVFLLCFTISSRVVASSAVAEIFGKE